MGELLTDEIHLSLNFPLHSKTFHKVYYSEGAGCCSITTLCSSESCSPRCKGHHLGLLSAVFLRECHSFSSVWHSAFIFSNMFFGSCPGVTAAETCGDGSLTFNSLHRVLIRWLKWFQLSTVDPRTTLQSSVLCAGKTLLCNDNGRPHCRQHEPENEDNMT